ncbi:hypothetical protein I5Q34_19735 [Streptomyces sp. AV19]|uniref:hypothetical protein n=1 Tax=Streptomyces sp. AV19 TaxID=2793068 RepID=UPI0018FE562B|nr:hypothetical protein [Streptomyces sp. AV19]MBH1936480.1 hypothetical protein [Streptomyces sp. AV19]MDG4532536.1 hypothetical protein [Streptomyces sp. AV19]
MRDVETGQVGTVVEDLDRRVRMRLHGADGQEWTCPKHRLRDATDDDRRAIGLPTREEP